MSDLFKRATWCWHSGLWYKFLRWFWGMSRWQIALLALVVVAFFAWALVPVVAWLIGGYQ